MNVENILKVANAIEQHSIPELGFNMFQWYGDDTFHRDISGHGCGTVACIGGWAGQVLLGNSNCTSQDLLDPLGIDKKQASALFFDWDTTIDVTPAQAVRTLRHLAATGAVNWNPPETEA